MSDHLKGAWLCVRLVVRTYPNRSSLIRALFKAYVWCRLMILYPELLGLAKPGVLGAGLKKLPGKVIVLLSLAKKTWPLILLFSDGT